MADKHSIAGTKFNKLTAIKPSGGTKKHPRWLFRCDCGNTKIIELGNARSGNTKSCGCISKRNAGVGAHYLGNTYRHMIARCYSVKCKEFRWYGARGISVCNSWRESFHNFLADIGDRPDGYSLDRIDNDGDYTPDNCRWATKAQQMENTTKARRITHNGETKTMCEWGRSLGGSSALVHVRVGRGWSVEDAITRPIRGR